MRLQRLLYKTGAWSFIALGLGHISTYLLAPASAERLEIFEKMQAFIIDMPGSQGNLYEYHLGFSLMMGILLIAYGVQALLSLRVMAATSSDSLPSLPLHTLVSAIVTMMAMRYFFMVPIVLGATAFLAFGTVWSANVRKGKQAL